MCTGEAGLLGESGARMSRSHPGGSTSPPGGWQPVCGVFGCMRSSCARMSCTTSGLATTHTESPARLPGEPLLLRGWFTHGGLVREAGPAYGGTGQGSSSPPSHCLPGLVKGKRGQRGPWCSLLADLRGKAPRAVLSAARRPRALSGSSSPTCPRDLPPRNGAQHVCGFPAHPHSGL